jgi:hypothetical protein
MKDLFEKWKTRVPRYSEDYQPLFDSLSNKGGGSSGKQVNLGKHFGNNYELYLYAFFLGLYRDEPIPVVENAKRNDFGHPIQFWGNMNNPHHTEPPIRSKVSHQSGESEPPQKGGQTGGFR